MTFHLFFYNLYVSNNDSNNIKQELEKLIPGYMMPRTIKIVDKLPVNQNGKIDRKALSELWK